jgi:hypothetical protein
MEGHSIPPEKVESATPREARKSGGKEEDGKEGGRWMYAGCLRWGERICVEGRDMGQSCAKRLKVNNAKGSQMKRDF